MHTRESIGSQEQGGREGEGASDLASDSRRGDGYGCNEQRRAVASDNTPTDPRELPVGLDLYI